MEHLVQFTTSEGRDAQHVAPSLDEALRFVERLRNAEEASVVRVFRLQEVPISFKTYYKVKLRPAVDDSAEASTPAAARPAPAPAPAPGRPVAEADQSDSSGRKLFSRT